MKALRVSRDITLLFLGPWHQMRVGVSPTPRLNLPPGKNPVPILQEAGWTPGPVWTGAENLVPTGISFLNFKCLYSNIRGTAVAQCLRCCATNRKFAGSIPAGVSGFFIDK